MTGVPSHGAVPGYLAEPRSKPVTLRTIKRMVQDGEPFPEPTPVDELDLDGGTLVLLQSRRPEAA